MPISLSAKKSLRTALKNYKANLFFKVKLKKTTKAFMLKPSNEGLQKVYSILDILGKKNIFHKNKVSRLKSKYSKVIASKDVSPKVVAKKKTIAKKKTAKKM